MLRKYDAAALIASIALPSRGTDTPPVVPNAIFKSSEIADSGLSRTDTVGVAERGTEAFHLEAAGARALIS
jgi:hypothetical protein